MGFVTMEEDAAQAAPAAPPAPGTGLAPRDRDIDLSRPVIKNPDGSISTEKTITIERGGRHILIPTIVDGKERPAEEAIKLYVEGRNKSVGMYRTAEEAEKAAVARSKRIGELRSGEGPGRGFVPLEEAEQPKEAPHWAARLDQALSRGGRQGMAMLEAVPSAVRLDALAGRLEQARIELEGIEKSPGASRTDLPVQMTGMPGMQERRKAQLLKQLQADQGLQRELVNAFRDYQRQVRAAGEGSIEFTDAVQGKGGFLEWLGQSLGQGAVVMVPLIAAGLVPGVGPALAAGGAVTLNRADIVGQRAEDETMYGMPGVGRPSAIEQAGPGDAQRLTEKLGREQGAIGAATAAYSALDFFLGPVGSVIGRTMGRKAAEKALAEMSASQAVKNVLAHAGVQTVEEFINEAGQEGISILMEAALDGKDIATAENAKRLLNAGAAGAVSGGVIGGGMRAGEAGLSRFRRTEPPSDDAQAVGRDAAKVAAGKEKLDVTALVAETNEKGETVFKTPSGDTISKDQWDTAGRRVREGWLTPQEPAGLPERENVPRETTPAEPKGKGKVVAGLRIDEEIEAAPPPEEPAAAPSPVEEEIKAAAPPKSERVAELQRLAAEADTAEARKELEKQAAAQEKKEAEEFKKQAEAEDLMRLAGRTKDEEVAAGLRARALKLRGAEPKAEAEKPEVRGLKAREEGAVEHIEAKPIPEPTPAEISKKAAAIAEEERPEPVGLAKPEKPAVVPTEKVIGRSESPILTALQAMGGVKEAELSDLGLHRATGKVRKETVKGKGGKVYQRIVKIGDQFQVGRKSLFRDDAKLGMDDVLEWMEQHGYMTQDEIDRLDATKPGGAVERAREILRNELETPGSMKPVAVAEQERIAEAAERRDEEADRAIRAEAEAIGIEVEGRPIKEVEAALRQAEEADWTRKTGRAPEDLPHAVVIGRANEIDPQAMADAAERFGEDDAAFIKAAQEIIDAHEKSEVARRREAVEPAAAPPGGRRQAGEGKPEGAAPGAGREAAVEREPGAGPAERGERAEAKPERPRPERPEAARSVRIAGAVPENLHELRVHPKVGTRGKQWLIVNQMGGLVMEFDGTKQQAQDTADEISREREAAASGEDKESFEVDNGQDKGKWIPAAKPYRVMLLGKGSGYNRGLDKVWVFKHLENAHKFIETKIKASARPYVRLDYAVNATSWVKNGKWQALPVPPVGKAAGETKFAPSIAPTLESAGLRSPVGWNTVETGPEAAAASQPIEVKPQASPDPKAAATLAATEETLREKYGLTPAQYSMTLVEQPATADHRVGAAVAKKLFGATLHWFTQKGPAVTAGFRSYKLRDAIFLEAKHTPYAAMRVTGHELLHHLKAKRPDIYNELVRTLAPILTNVEAHRRGLPELYRGPKGELPSEMQALEELVADIVGDRFMEPEFWGEVARLNPTRFQAIAKAIIKFINEVIAKAQRAGMGSDQYVTDLRKARYAIAQAVNRFHAEVAEEREAAAEARDLQARINQAQTRFMANVVDMQEPPPKAVAWVPTPKQFATAGKKWLNGEITDEQMQRVVRDELDKRADRGNQARARVRGADWVRERLLRARRTGELGEYEVEMALWLVNQSPQVATDLGISIREGNDSATRGLYDAVARVVTIFSSNSSDATATHEILHHTELMMPRDVRAGIRAEWSVQLREGMQTAAEKLAVPVSPDASKATKQRRAEEIVLLEWMREAVDRGDEGLAVKIWQGFGRAGQANLMHLIPYKLAAPSEFWAVNATRIIEGRFQAQHSWVARAKQWLGELVQKARGILRLPSDAAVLRGLRAVQQGNGSYVTRTLLTRDASTLADVNEDATARATDLIDRYRKEFGTTPKGMDRAAWMDFHKRRRAAEEALGNELARMAERDGLMLPTKWGGHAAVTPDASAPGKWRVTTFTADMRPSGHEVFPDAQTAARDLASYAATPLEPPDVPAPAETPAKRAPFEEWFEGSKVVDEKGKPRVVYHVPAKSDEFAMTAGGRPRTGHLGAMFTTTPIAPDATAAYLKILNPLDAREPNALKGKSPSESLDEFALRTGHDGFITQLGEYVVLKPDQVRAVPRDMAARAPAPPFFSALERQVAAIDAKAMPAADWIKRINTLKGVKKEEIEYTGVTDWLAAQGTTRVAKAAVQEFLNDNGVVVSTVERGQLQAPEGYKLNNEFGEWQFTYLGRPVVDPKTDIGTTRETETGEDPIAVIADLKQRFANRAANFRERLQYPNLTQPEVYRLEALEDFWKAEVRKLQKLIKDYSQDKFAKYGDWVMPGAKNYRELLLTLPITPATEAGKARRRAIFEEYEQRIDTFYKAGQVHQAMALERERDKKANTAYRLPEDRPRFRQGHFEQDNVLAHVRINERTDANGKRVLFVEEIQSDWAQKGREQGFATDDIEQLRSELEDVERQKSRLALLRDPITNVMRDEKQWHALAKQAEDLTKRISAMFGQMPAGPFVGKTEAWTALALKRVIRYAAENGFDRVAWTTGEQQNIRYALSHHLERVEWDTVTHHDGTESKEVELTPQRASPAKLAVNMRTGEVMDVRGAPQLGGLIGETLDRVLGKDLADMILSERKGSRSGRGLEVGGEGMRAFYNKILPNIANDILKKLGGGRVTSFSLPTKEGVRPGAGERDFAYATLSDIEGNNHWVTEKDDHKKVVAGPFKTAEEARAWLLANDPALQTTQPGFDITPEMREQALAGQPMFVRRPQAKPEPGRTTAADLEAAGADPVKMKEHKEKIDAKIKDFLGAKAFTWMEQNGLLRPMWSWDDPNPLARDPDVPAYTSADKTRVVLYYDRIPNVEDVPRLLVHEIGTHFGMRRMLGEQGFNDVLEQLRAGKQSGDPAITAAWERVKRNYIVESPQPFFTEGSAPFLEEVAAAMVESAPNDSFVRRLLARVRAWVHQYISPRLAGQMDATLLKGLTVAALRKAGRGELSTAATPAPDQAAEDSTARIMMARPGRVPPPRSVATTHASVAEKWLDFFNRHFLDSFSQLKKRTLANTNARMLDALNTYAREQLMHGRATERMKDLGTDYLTPLIKIAGEAELTREDVSDGLYAMHAAEANAYIASINPAMPDRGSGISDRTAQQILNSYTPQQRQALDRISTIVQRMNRAKLDRYVAEGLITPQDRTTMLARYKHWMSLKQMDDEELFGFSGGLSVRGKEFQARTGRYTQAEDPLSMTVRDAMYGIMRAEKNRVAKSFYDFVLAHPNPALWHEVTPANFPVHPMPNARTGQVQMVPDPRALWEDPKFFGVKVNGEQKWIEIKDPLLAEQMKKLGDHGIDSNNELIRWILKAVNGTTRLLSRFYTQFSFDFALVNPIRDVQQGLLVATSLDKRKGKQLALRMLKNLPAGLKDAAMANLQELRGRHPGGLYEQFRQDGGTTGGYGLDDARTIQNDMERALAALNGDLRAKAVKQVDKWLLKPVSALNDSFENMSRFAVYKAALEMRENGQPVFTREQAAVMAKNVTVNFNKRGMASPAFNMAYAFFNAAMQANAAAVRAVMRSRTVQVVSAALFAAGAFAALGDEEDERGIDESERTSEFVQDRNITIPFGDKKAAKIPLAYGFNIPYATGRHLVRVLQNKESVGHMLGAIAKLGFTTFLPTDSLVPTVGQPIADVVTGTDFAGRRIAKEDPFDYVTPKSSQYRENANAAAVAFFKALNAATGGTEYTAGAIDISPEKATYFVKQYLGGLAAPLEIAALPFAEKTTAADYPVVRRFVAEAKEDVYITKASRAIREAHARSKDIEAGASAKPGEEEYVDQLRAYDSALRRLAATRNRMLKEDKKADVTEIDEQRNLLADQVLTARKAFQQQEAAP